MRKKIKYNYDNAWIIVAYQNGQAENIIDANTKENILKYIDKFFTSVFSANKEIEYKIYTSVLTKEKATEKFPNLQCEVCGNITNKKFITYRGYYCVGRSIECTICQPEYDYFTSNKNNFKTILKLLKYNEVKKYKKAVKKTYGNFIKKYYKTV